MTMNPPAPSLSNDNLVDPGIATVSVCLWDRFDGGITNAVQLLVRPINLRADESGEHPGESFVMVTITREEMRAMLTELDADWTDTVRVCGDPNAQPSLADKSSPRSDA